MWSGTCGSDVVVDANIILILWSRLPVSVLDVNGTSVHVTGGEEGAETWWVGLHGEGGGEEVSMGKVRVNLHSVIINPSGPPSPLLPSSRVRGGPNICSVPTFQAHSDPPLRRDAVLCEATCFPEWRRAGLNLLHVFLLNSFTCSISFFCLFFFFQYNVW